MSEITFDDIYQETRYNTENGDLESLESMDLEEIYTIAMKEVDINDSPKAHILLSTYYWLKGDKENKAKEDLKSAYLGCCSSVMDYSSQMGTDSVEILGIVKAMNDADESLASRQGDFDYEMEKISPEKRIQITAIADEVKSTMKKRNLEFFW